MASNIIKSYLHECELLHVHKIDLHLIMQFREKPIIKWMIRNKDILKIHTIARRAGMPGSTLKMFVEGTRNTIPEQYENQLIVEVKKILAR